MFWLPQKRKKPKRNHFRRLLRSRLSVRQNLVYVVASVNSDFKKDRESTDNKNLKLGLKQSPFQEDIERWLRKRRSKGLLGSFTQDDFGRATSFCTAQEYRMGSLFQHFLEMGIPVELYGDVIHATYQDFEPVVDIFVFPYGAVVTWGLDEESESLVLQTVCSFERTPLSSPEMDSFRYNFGSQWKISRDCITLVETTGERAVLEKLAVSHAMAQSVKLSAFEDSVQNTIAATRHLPEELARYGSISQSRTEISKNLGRLILDRHQVYLHADVLDTPEFFWEYEAFEPLYRSAERYLELRQRAELLNKRVEIVRELFDLLSQELQFKHNSDLEIIIICLITFEIIISLLKDLFPIFVNGSLVFHRSDGFPVTATIAVTVVLTVLLVCVVIYIWQAFVRKMRRKRTLEFLKDGLQNDGLEWKDE
ncbi:uncharacterized protein Gasu_61970 [Galdieria sulphuraria]|uniref:DUF155 domain-containing protein n=1 Tax=Galdieria sulphuraria TaxID=130081 RepID=M2X8I1_GALSU|nr:uncharacterized protein Gasu_61970 [Galdieria sulphuraria]EME26157.1 hypothetical protein Gasu_61970 [Galdieria sulphuraria]|eukprot:XP_005702677.1 hypothetical protein Gasu_61970 [Galdieria sulphuraria]